MKKYSVVVMLAIVLLSVIGLRTPARAQDAQVVVSVPFEFIAGTKTLPAGNYTVRSTSGTSNSPLLIGSHDAGAMLLPIAFDDKQVSDASFRFTQVGGKYVLSEIKTPDGTYNVADRRETTILTKLAQSDQHKDGLAPSGSQ